MPFIRSRSPVRILTNEQGEAPRTVGEEEPPSYESLIHHQNSIAQVEDNGKPVNIRKPPYQRKSVICLVILLCSLLILGIFGFSLNFSRTQDVNSELHHIKHNHIPRLQQETHDVNERADKMQRMIEQMLDEMDDLKEEIQRLRGEAKDADELRKDVDESFPFVYKSVSGATSLTFTKPLTFITLLVFLIGLNP